MNLEKIAAPLGAFMVLAFVVLDNQKIVPELWGFKYHVVLLPYGSRLELLTDVTVLFVGLMHFFNYAFPFRVISAAVCLFICSFTLYRIWIAISSPWPDAAVMAANNTGSFYYSPAARLAIYCLFFIYCSWSIYLLLFRKKQLA